ncbi:SusD/RagB family nutrient-binding outer membrane lipoprotein [Mucilaginibacter sp. RB4R14]|uniref:SusD/RagB family nutrient-binding outer membrane lipoprotein n=1 Tax=Mucilaginibacter aurantiaciroseus TaxID=2949308 RepID=UPI002091233D|nr:SusD/RagB family nutrient-binding outer membrane lipoprotein [Mucilaginibacter aurantiaciroseus]MCO5936682.1 SusD/RagB family nutrient-binding outer membrane lipoprotein [Mucilaginibacter aurantiaciroseus]
MKKHIIIILGLFIIGTSGCKKDFLSLEENPNTPSVTTPQFLLTGALKTAADIVNINYAHYGVWAGQLSPSGNYVPSPQLQQYQFTTDNYQVFTPLYLNLSNFNNLEVLAKSDPTLTKFQAIAKIMKAYDFEQLVDNYGDVPYTEAFQQSKTFFPKYDKGQAIYTDLIKQLDAAVALIDGSTSALSPDVSDIVFKGDMIKWRRFALTLKLRMAIRTNVKVAGLPAAGTDYLDASTLAATQPGYANSDALNGQQSPFYRSFGFDQNGNPTGNNAYYRASAFEVGLLNSYSDPRISKFYATTSGGKIVGIILGDNTAIPNSGTSAIGAGLLKDPTMAGVLMSSAEALFLQAEGVTNGFITGDAQQLYQSGITASFMSVGLTAVNATTYYTQAKDNVSWVASTNKQQAIVTQKWISLTGYSSLESYNELRRTGYPAGVPRSIDNKAIGTGLPTRIFYPTTEYQQNPDNVGAEGIINPFGTKIFWAK